MSFTGNQIGSRIGTTPASGADSATARELATALGALPVDALSTHQAQLADAITELANSAGRPWVDAHGDVVVVLLRALAKLALKSPDATSVSAARLLDRVAAEHVTVSGVAVSSTAATSVFGRGERPSAPCVIVP